MAGKRTSMWLLVAVVVAVMVAENVQGYENVDEMVADWKDGASETKDSWGGWLKDKFSGSPSEKMSMEGVKQGAEDVYDGTKQKVGEAYDSTKEGMKTMTEKLTGN